MVAVIDEASSFGGRPSLARTMPFPCQRSAMGQLDADVAPSRVTNRRMIGPRAFKHPGEHIKSALQFTRARPGRSLHRWLRAIAWTMKREGAALGPARRLCLLD